MVCAAALDSHLSSPHPPPPPIPHPVPSPGFHPLFMRPVSFERKFDCSVRIALDPSAVRKYPVQLLDRGGDWEALAAKFIGTLFVRGASTLVLSSTPICTSPTQFFPLRTTIIP